MLTPRVNRSLGQALAVRLFNSNNNKSNNNSSYNYQEMGHAVFLEHNSRSNKRYVWLILILIGFVYFRGAVKNITFVRPVYPPPPGGVRTYEQKCFFSQNLKTLIFLAEIFWDGSPNINDTTVDDH